MIDRRDPTILGEELLALKKDSRMKRLSKVYDRFKDQLQAIPWFSDPKTSIERYGDPVAVHEAKIEAGLAVRLP